MKKNDKLWSKNIHGQSLQFCSVEEWGNVLEVSNFNGVPIPDVLLKFLTSMVVPVYMKHIEIELGILADTFEKRYIFRYYPLLLVDGKYVRIDIVGAKCSNCTWKGYIGTPISSDIYFGISSNFNPYELMRKSREYPAVDCPVCGTKFNQFAIWVGNI